MMPFAQSVVQGIAVTPTIRKQEPNKHETVCDRIEVSLSRYFSQGTEYFYAFPSGEDSQFFNGVPPAIEELVAARPLVCAGDHVKVITFSSSMHPVAWGLLRDEMGVPLIEKDHVIVVPAAITAELQGQERNVRLKTALHAITSESKFVMAQPYLDQRLHDRYQINPDVTVWLNDKRNMTTYIPSSFLPIRYQTFQNGATFSETTQNIPAPCVVKISSSSSGDGVRLCQNDADLAEAKRAFATSRVTIIVEEYLQVARNLCIQFGIPADGSQPIEILGFNQQVIAKSGEFLGGIVNLHQHIPQLQEIYSVLKEHVLPTVRDLGWYGIGGIDVLITPEGRFCFVDSNFRMTATVTYVCEALNGLVTKPMMSFAGTFRGTEQDFRKQIVPLAKMASSSQLLNIISLTYANNLFRFNAALLFDHDETRADNAKQVIKAGVEARVLEQLACEGRG